MSRVGAVDSVALLVPRSALPTLTQRLIGRQTASAPFVPSPSFTSYRVTTTYTKECK